MGGVGVQLGVSQMDSYNTTFPLGLKHPNPKVDTSTASGHAPPDSGSFVPQAVRLRNS